METIHTNKNIYSKYLVKDYNGIYKRHIVFLKPILKDGWEEESCSNLDFENLETNDFSIGEQLNEEFMHDCEQIYDDKLRDCENDENENVRKATSRAKNTIRDLVILNDWTHFITLTFDPKKYDSTNKADVDKIIKKFIHNHLTKKKIPFILLPEYHADKQKIHFHGLINDKDHKLRYFKTDKKAHGGQDVYNLDSWKYGFSTAIELDYTNIGKIKISNYVTKYVTKDIQMILKQYYFCARDLNRKPKKIYPAITPSNYKDWFFNGFCYIYDEVL